MLNFVKIKIFSLQKTPETEEIFAKGISDKGLVFKSHKELLKFNIIKVAT
jgi:hypothetical protein